jgi:hypothetical protein
MGIAMVHISAHPMVKPFGGTDAKHAIKAFLLQHEAR